MMHAIVRLLFMETCLSKLTFMVMEGLFTTVVIREPYQSNAAQPVSPYRVDVKVYRSESKHGEDSVLKTSLEFE